MTAALALFLLPGCLWGYYDDPETGNPPGDTAITSDGGSDGGVDGGGADGGDDGGGCEELPYYTDEDGDDWGTTQAGQACEIPEEYAAMAGDCDDENSAVNPGQAEVCDDGLDNDCDPATGTVEDPNCRFNSVLSAASADTILTTDNAAADLGDRVELCADLTGDGVADLALGARARLDTQKGSVYLVSGSARGTTNVDSSTDAFRLRTTSFDNELGSEMRCGGDFGKDGYADIAAAAANETTTAGAEAGRIGVHFGPLASARVYDEEADVVIDGTSAEGYLGSAMDIADWNEDGFLDLAVGARGVRNSEDTLVGAVYLFSGSVLAGRSSLDTSEATVTLLSRDAAAEFGDRGSIRLDDLTGDGAVDLAASAELWDGTKPNVGRMWVVPDVTGLGATSTDTATVASIRIEGSGTDELNLGAAVTSGDLTGDGISDLVALGESYYLAALVFDLSSHSTGDVLSESDAVASISRGVDACGGYAADARGDIDGDGAADLVFDGHCSDTDANDLTGIVWGFHGPLSAGTYVADTGADFKVTTDQEGAKLGRDLSTAGDVNGDGKAELLVGAHEFPEGGRAFLFLGQGL